jgi:hypothetical protein
VLSAGATRALELTPKRLARAVETHSGISRSQLELPRSLGDVDLIEVHPPEDALVVGAQDADQIADADADDALEALVSPGASSSAPRDLSEPSVGPGALAIVVGQRVSQDAIEPGDRSLLARKRLPVLDPFHERGLEDVFRVVPRADSLLEKGKKPPMILNEDRKGFQSAIPRLGHQQVVNVSGGETEIGTSRTMFASTVTA